MASIISGSDAYACSVIIASLLCVSIIVTISMVLITLFNVWLNK